jgi:hypothetical protein
MARAVRRTNARHCAAFYKPLMALVVAIRANVKRCGLSHSTPPELVTEDSPWGAHVCTLLLSGVRQRVTVPKNNSWDTWGVAPQTLVSYVFLMVIRSVWCAS